MPINARLLGDGTTITRPSLDSTVAVPAPNTPPMTTDAITAIIPSTPLSR